MDDNKNVYYHNLSQELLAKFNEKHKNSIYLSQFDKQVECLISEKRTEEAKTLCLTEKNDMVLTGAANYHLGILYRDEQDYQNAISSFIEAYKNDYKKIESLDGIASVYFRRGEYEKAIRIYNDIQDEKGYDPRIWCNIGACYLRLDKNEEAIHWFDKAIKADEKDAFPYYNKGVAYYKLKNYSTAKECMEKSIELDPTNMIYRSEYMKCFHSGKF